MKRTKEHYVIGATIYSFLASWADILCLIPKSLFLVSQNKCPVWLLNVLFKG